MADETLLEERIRYEARDAMRRMSSVVLAARTAGKDEHADRLSRVRDEWARAIAIFEAEQARNQTAGAR